MEKHVPFPSLSDVFGLRLPHLCAAQAHRTLAGVAADAQRQGDRGGHLVLWKGRLDLVVPSVAYGTVTAGVAGVNRHSHPGKAGGQIVAEGRDHGFLGVEHSPHLSIGVQLPPESGGPA